MGESLPAPFNPKQSKYSIDREKKNKEIRYKSTWKLDKLDKSAVNASFVVDVLNKINLRIYSPNTCVPLDNSFFN